MIKADTPGIVLSFDDWHEREWARFLPTLAAHKIRATFYPCLKNIVGATATVRRSYFDTLRRLADAGHAVGYHTLTHAIIEAARGVPTNALIDAEIIPGLEMFEKAGLPRPRHFAYPGGKHNVASDDALLEIFDTVRTIVPEDNIGQMIYYSPQRLAADRVFMAYDLHYPGVFNAVRRTLEEKRVGFFFAHNPELYKATLRRLLDMAEAAGAAFYSTDDIMEGR